MTGTARAGFFRFSNLKKDNAIVLVTPNSDEGLGYINDVSGSYPAFDGNKSIQKIEDGQVYYDDFSLWDTHRAQLPLVSLVAPDKYEDMMKSLVLKAEQGI